MKKYIMRHIDKLMILIILFSFSSAYADKVSRLKAVTYVLTGHDYGNIETFDEDNCIYIEKGTSSRTMYFLNKVQATRTKINKYTITGVINPIYEIKLYGSEPFYIIKAMTKEEMRNSKEELREGIRAMSNKFDNPRDKYNEEEIEHLVKQNWTPRSEDILKTELTLSLGLDDIERYKRAWAYIYSNGCVAAKDDF